MRYGKNPTKFARHHSGIVQLEVKYPRPLSVVTVTYVPRLHDYYSEGLDILRLTLSQIRKTTPVPFDLLVFDNGSCPEVVEFLVDMKNRGEIHCLILSPDNLKKFGAINYLFTAAKGDYIYYFDSDILHLPGWYEAAMEIMEAFPAAGLVNAGPIPSGNQHVVATTYELAREDKEIEILEGPVFTEQQLRANAEALDANVEAYVGKASKRLNSILKRGGVAALPVSTHSHFLMRAEVVRKIMPLPRDWALHHKDMDFDVMVAEAGFMRLGSLTPHVAHLGNSLTPRWVQFARENEIELTGRRIRPRKSNRSLFQRVLENRLVHGLLLRLHALTFRLLYNVK